jgi:RNA polymerase sigma-70 factor (ECF subfamily)
MPDPDSKSAAGGIVQVIQPHPFPAMKSNGPSPTIFRTRWSLIEQARSEDPESAAAKDAIAQIILRYRPAILGAIRRHGIDSTDSEDLCQDFLMKIFLSKTLPRADRSRGRFRTFLLHSLRHFVASWHRSALALKRGGGQVGSLDEMSPGELDTALAFEEPQTEFEFEMDFARCLHAQVLERLQLEYAEGNRGRVFAKLAPRILRTDQVPDEGVAEDLGLSPVAARQALSRLRHRYFAAFQSHIAQFLDGGDDLHAETKDLLKLVWAALNITTRGAALDLPKPNDDS